MHNDIILVDASDQQIGTTTKQKAHARGLLHRAFSVFVYNDKKEILLQQRAITKYHSPGLWANTCCSHPRPEETTLTAAQRRLQEEMGFTCELKEVGSFVYKAHFNNGLIEHEFDHILIGTHADDPTPNKDEVADWQWMSPDAIARDLQRNTHLYAPWFPFAFKKIYAS